MPQASTTVSFYVHICWNYKLCNYFFLWWSLIKNPTFFCSAQVNLSTTSAGVTMTSPRPHGPATSATTTALNQSVLLGGNSAGQGQMYLRVSGWEIKYKHVNGPVCSRQFYQFLWYKPNQWLSNIEEGFFEEPVNVHNLFKVLFKDC